MGQFTYLRPKLYAKQTEAFFNPARYSCIEGSTKSGKTVSCMAWLVEQALVHLGKEDREFWWVAPVIGTAKIAFRRMKRSLPKGHYKAHNTDMTLTLSNGAVIRFKGGEKPDNLYSEDVWAAVLDEPAGCGRRRGTPSARR